MRPPQYWEMKARSGFGKINGIPYPPASLNLEIASQVQSVEDFEKIRKNDVTLKRDNTIFKLMIAPL